MNEIKRDSLSSNAQKKANIVVSVKILTGTDQSSKQISMKDYELQKKKEENRRPWSSSNKLQYLTLSKGCRKPTGQEMASKAFHGFNLTDRILTPTSPYAQKNASKPQVCVTQRRYSELPRLKKNIPQAKLLKPPRLLGKVLLKKQAIYSKFSTSGITIQTQIPVEKSNKRQLEVEKK